MSELAISSSGWLAISSRNGTAVIFNLKNHDDFQIFQVQQTNNKENSSDDEEIDLNRNLIQFSPNGDRLVVNGQNKQIFIYRRSDELWNLEKTINVKKRASAFHLTNNLLLIGDKSGDVYRLDLSKNDEQTTVTLNADDCLMGHLSMLLDIVYFDRNEKQKFILTSDRDEKIRISHFPNAYNIYGYCLGHTEFVSQLKVIDENQILSSSGDGSLCIWSVETCTLLAKIDSQEILKSRKILSHSNNVESTEENRELSTIDLSIWKTEISQSDRILISFSIFADRSRSIFLVEFDQKENCFRSSVELKICDDEKSIVDFVFSSNEIFLLFDDGTLSKIDVESTLKSNSIVSSNEFSSKFAEKMSEANFRPINRCQTHLNIFQQLFKSRSASGNSSYYKRKTDRLQAEQEKKKKKNLTSLSEEK